MPKKVVVKKEKVKKVAVRKNTAELISFSVRAVIPTMVFGNIQPEVIVKAKTIEDAQAFALPIIEALYEKYCETPRDGSSKPSFLSKASVMAVEKFVPQDSIKGGDLNPERTKPTASTPVAQKETEPEVAKTPAFEKGEKAISAATSIAALDMIETQIRASTKLTPHEKPPLYLILLKKKKEFNS